jgi:hypothetical protein
MEGNCMEYEEKSFIKNTDGDAGITVNRSVYVRGEPSEEFFKFIEGRMDSARREFLREDLADAVIFMTAPSEITD